MISRQSKGRCRKGRCWVAPALTLLMILWTAATPCAETLIQGHIGQDQVWAKENGPYRLTGQLTVAEGAMLTIPGGAVVRFDPGSRIEIKGTLAAEAALFDGNEEIHNREAIYFHAGSRGRLERCIIQDLTLEIHTSKAAITHNLIANRNGSGITVGKDHHPTITWNDFHSNSYYAVYKEGRDVLRAPENFWGAADGPSGAGSGKGNPVNAPVDFTPYQKTDIGEYLMLADDRLDRTAAAPGSMLTLTYVIDNFNSYPHAVILGASLAREAAPHIHSPDHDLRITVFPGRHRFTRAFAIPAKTPEGRYDMIWGVMHADLSAYHVLKRDRGRLQIDGGPPTSPAGIAATGPKPSKATP